MFQQENLEEISDYVIGMMDEIGDDMRLVMKNSSYIRDKLDKITTRLRNAKKKGINVSKLEDQFFDFRKTILLSKIRNKMETFERCESYGEFYIQDILDEFYDLKHLGINVDDIKHQIVLLEHAVERGKIRYQIHHLYVQGNNSEYDLQKILQMLEKARKSGIKVKDLEKDILGE